MALMLSAAIGCAEVGSADLGDPYTAGQLIQAQNEDASAFDQDWKGARINVIGVVDRIDDGKIYLVADGFSDYVALDDLSREERRLWDPGDEAEYACEIGGYEPGTILMIDCGPAEYGGAVSGALSSATPVLEYWSLPALLIASVLTVTALARSTWKGWQPAMVAVMCLGVLAILNAAATVVFGYTTVDTQVLTSLAAVSFVAICILGWVVLNPGRFPRLSGVSPQTLAAPTPTAQPQPASTPVSQPVITNVSGGQGAVSGGQATVSGSQATSIASPGASPGSPSPAAPSDPSQTMAMQPNVATSMAWLVVTGGPSEGKSIQLKDGNNTIGRSLENDLQIDDASVSRSHAMVSVREDQFTLVDLGSSGGTRIGEHRISGRRIEPGSVITVGQTRLGLMSVDAYQGGPSSGATMIGSVSGSSLSLIAQSGPDAGKSFLLTSSQNVIGRDSSAQVALSDPTVSRRHAMVRVDADRTTISDLGSRSGTRVGGEVIQGVRISVGDRVVIGQSEFTLMRPSG